MPRPDGGAVTADASPQRAADLPEGWTWTTLGEVSEKITKGSTPTSYGFAYQSQGIRFIKTENITPSGFVNDDFTFIDEQTNEFLKRSKLQSGDLLFSIAGTIGRVGIVQSKDLPANTNQALAIVRSRHEIIETKYLFHLLNSPLIQKHATSSVVGVGRANLSLQNLNESIIPLAPLAEQRRIVAAIESLFTKLEAGVAALQRAQANLRRYKASVLKAACEGRLTNNDRSSDTAAKLLTDLGKSPLREEGLSSLPDGWCWAKIADIGSERKYAIVDGPFGSMLKTSDYVEDGEVPVITISNIDLGFEKSNLRFITKEKFETIKRSAVNPGDILVAKIGASYGKVGYYPDWMPVGIIPANLLKITPHQKISKEYVYYYLKSSGFKRKLDKITKSTAQPAFNVSMFRELPIPLPPLTEQHRIVAEVERRLSVVAALEQALAHNLARAEKLRQAILKKAFAGRLVGQDPSDESAEKLMEHIEAFQKLDVVQPKTMRPETKGKKVNKDKKRRSLHETLITAGVRLTPEQLFDGAGFDESNVDDFYAELRAEIAKGRIHQIRPNEKDAYIEGVEI